MLNVSVLLIMNLTFFSSSSLFFFWTQQQTSQVQPENVGTKLSHDSGDAEGGGSKKTKPHKYNWTDGMSSQSSLHCLKDVSKSTHFAHFHTHTQKSVPTHTLPYTLTFKHTYTQQDICILALLEESEILGLSTKLDLSSENFIVKWHAFRSFFQR